MSSLQTTSARSRALNEPLWHLPSRLRSDALPSSHRISTVAPWPVTFQQASVEALSMLRRPIPCNGKRMILSRGPVGGSFFKSAGGAAAGLYLAGAEPLAGADARNRGREGDPGAARRPQGGHHAAASPSRAGRVSARRRKRKS